MPVVSYKAEATSLEWNVLAKYSLPLKLADEKSVGKIGCSCLIIFLDKFISSATFRKQSLYPLISHRQVVGSGRVWVLRNTNSL
jgi:hypothetical protein